MAKSQEETTTQDQAIPLWMPGICTEDDCKENLKKDKLKQLHITGGFCPEHYAERRRNNICAFPGCNEIAREVPGHWGVYCDEHLQTFVTNEQCSFVGCNNPSTVTLSGYPVCSAHAEANHPPKNYDRKPREERGNGHDHDRGASNGPHTSAPSITQDDLDKVKPLTLNDLLMTAGVDQRHKQIAVSEMGMRVWDLLKDPQENDSKIQQLALLLPPRAARKTPAEPEPEPPATPHTGRQTSSRRQTADNTTKP